MGKKDKGAEETSVQRAFADVARSRMADFRTRWQPLQRLSAQRTLKAGEQGSWERRRAAGAVTADNDAQFGQANVEAVERAAATGQLGTSKQKLGVVGMGNDQAASRGLATVAADQAGDDALISGIGQAVALGSGQAASAVDSMGQLARMSGRQAAADARESLERNAMLGEAVGAAAGIGAGAYGRRDAGSGLAIDYDGRGVLPGDSPLSSTGSVVRARR